MSEFTGERVIPGQVNEDLWAEHIARYAFAARFVEGKRVLDLGCGSGYGTAELARNASAAVGIDVAKEAIEYARAHFPGPRFEQASATAIPFEAGSFDVVTAFEVIEHLQDWRMLLAESKRVLDPAGVLIVSTPNKLYYAEARAESGPNPFHEHEFEFDEYRAVLTEYFPHVELLLQDRMDAFGFYAPGKASGADACIDDASDDPTTANFFVGICSQIKLPDLRPMLYVPKASNLLRVRERHIGLLEDELKQVRTWLDEMTTTRDGLLAEHTKLKEHLDEQNRWAQELDSQRKVAQERVVELQDEVAAAQTRANEVIASLREENQSATNFTQSLAEDLNKRKAELAETVRLLDRAEANVVERTRWAQRVTVQREELETILEHVRMSRWVKAGRAIGIGPTINSPVAPPAEPERK